MLASYQIFQFTENVHKHQIKKLKFYLIDDNVLNFKDLFPFRYTVFDLQTWTLNQLL